MEKWKSELREQMEGFRMDPPEGLWDSIEEKTAGQKAAAVPWLRYTAVAATVAAILAGTGLLFRNGIRNIERPEIAVAVAPVQETEKENIAGDQTTARLAENTVSDQTSLQAIESATYDGAAKTVILDNNAEEKVNSAAKDIAEKDGNDRLPTVPEKADFPDENDIIEIYENRQKKGRLAGNLSFSGTPGSSNSHSGYSDGLVSRSAMSSFSFGNDPMADIATYNTGQEINTQYRHYQPVRIGISARYSLGRLSLESGIAYSCLYSRLRSGSERYYYTGSQQLHYIGIPLNIGCNIWDNGRLAVYVSAGGTLEKCLGGSQRTEYSYNGASGTTQNEKLSIRPLQWSVQAAAGLQYNFTGLVGMYMEPGISYHFRSGSTSVRSIYTDRPLNFSLALGVRFNIL